MRTRVWAGAQRWWRDVVAVVVALLALGTLTPIASPAAAQDAPISETITISGRGWGHGRGLGQWGAFGYATGRSGGPWAYRTILGHFYGDTDVGGIANPLAAVTLLDQRTKPLAVERAAGVAVDGREGTWPAVRATLRGDGRYDLSTADGCFTGVWSEPVVVDGPVRLRAPGTTGERDDVLRLCNDDGTTIGYRGELVAMQRSFDGGDVGLAQTVNLVRLDDLLKGMLPLQLPPAWADIDGGLGRGALLAQAVASRGFAAAGDGRWRDLHSGIGASFSTCDTTMCQPYGGVTPEDPRTDAAVRETSGEVRVRGATLVRTEYTASTGGWTAGVTFPPVPDVGDGVAANPHHRWTALLDRAELEARYGLGRLQAIETDRNGLGADGGRVLQIRLVGTAATQELTGTAFRLAFGLRSDWFTVSGAPPRPPVSPRDTEQSCPADTVPDAGFADVTDANVHGLAIDCVAWWGVAAGTGEARFGPSQAVTRAQMASFVARLVEVSGGELPPGPDAFTDDDGSVHEEAINSLAALGVVRGTGGGLYEPQGFVERAQGAALLARALDHLGIALPAEPSDAFADDTGSVHEPAINALAAEGIVTGVSAGRLQPHAPTRRDQMASLLARTLDLVVERTGVEHP